MTDGDSVQWTVARTGAANWVGAGRKPAMFKILELKSAVSLAAEVGRRYSTREDALVALKKHLKTFKISGFNREGSYRWARDAEDLRKCWISAAE